MAAFGNVVADRENFAFLVEQELKVHLLDDALTRLGDLCQTRSDAAGSFGGPLDSAGKRAQLMQRSIPTRQRFRDQGFELCPQGSQLHQRAVADL